MRVNRGFLQAYVDRFRVDPSEEWLNERLIRTFAPLPAQDADPAMLCRRLQLDLDEIYVPTKEGIRIGKWIYGIARGFTACRYCDPAAFVDICLGSEKYGPPGVVGFDPESVPIYAVDGLPGAGKSALVRALARLFPPPMELSAEGNPPQRVGTISAVWLRESPNFGLVSWARTTLEQLGVDLSRNKSAKTLGLFAQMLRKTFYRLGVSVLLVDELQFSSGKESARRVLGQLLSMREFGVPIIFFSNTDLIKHIREAPAQLSQRIPRERKTFLPVLREDRLFAAILKAQLDLLPCGHAINLESDATDVYDMVAGSPRASGRLIEIAFSMTAEKRRPINFRDIVAAKRSPSFDSMRDHVALLSATYPVDASKRPELASNNDEFDAAKAYADQMKNQRLEEATKQAVFASYSSDERKASQAVETRILRESGKIGDNVTALDEAKNRRTKKGTPADLLKESYAAKHLAKSPTHPSPINDKKK